MDSQEAAKQFLVKYFAKANQLNHVIKELDQLRAQGQPDPGDLEQKTKDYGDLLDSLNAGKEQLDQSLKKVGFDKPLADFTEEELQRLSKILAP
ncbi:hypothetical protein LFYK43_00180 [Ligilactobacillus salitolerans]|uniref:Uncharacterized protein n=1 Tax=Ligilactobacillus salitolerans TaxID=1808352 RepID=A0A401IPV3_9LACO|nr:hypothetical protein [Ligilactobacillus salitolerans]GBG93559.1 hypothetical protein LFYK43_00180 [Ligilactobacillus salitolerans]